MSKFSVAVIDCPWEYSQSKAGQRMGSAVDHYPTLNLEALKALPIRSVLHKNALAFVWVTGPLMHYGPEVIKAWDMYYRGIAFVWTKTKKDGGAMGARGTPPSFTKSNVELLLLASTMKSGRALPIRKFNTLQVVPHPPLKHSQKPEIFQDHIEETLVPCGPYLELFARRYRPGWVCLGNELTGRDIREDIALLSK